MNSKAFKPNSLNEALQILAENDGLIFAGGTDLMVQYSRGTGLSPIFPKPPLFIGRLTELRQIQLAGESVIIGAAVTLSELLDHPAIPLIFKTIISQMASLPSRNTASIGGNICNASPAGDTLPYLIAQNAKIRLQSLHQERLLSVAEFITGPKTSALKKGELLTEIIIPLEKFNHTYYQKIGQRKGMSLTKASFLGLALTENAKLKDLRIAFGAVAPKIVRNEAIENKYIGISVNQIPEYLDRISDEYEPFIQAIDDARSSAIYRKQVSLRLLRDFLNQISQK